jgi:alkylhydroperoxidase family enzyme
VRQAATDFRGLDLPDRTRAMRESGLSDADIPSVNLVVSSFNFVNRIAEGLGVEHSEEEVTGYPY